MMEATAPLIRLEDVAKLYRMGDVEVRCSTPRKPEVEYEFRVLLDGRKPPRAANPPAEALVSTVGR